MFVPPIRKTRSKADVRRLKAAQRPPAPSDRSIAPDAAPGVSWSFGQTPVFPTASKVVIGAADDPLERDADRAADSVTAASNNIPALPSAPAPANPPATAPRAVSQVLSEPGRPLDAATRGFMESGFRLDFSRSRLRSKPVVFALKSSATIC